MNTQDKIKAAISSNPELVIEKAIQFKPTIAEMVEAARKVEGPLSGVAAVAIRHALYSTDKAATLANLEAFAASI